MKKQLFATIVALVASTGLAVAESNKGIGAHATNVNVNSASQAVANSQAQAGAIASGGSGGNSSVVFNTPSKSSQNVHYSGSQTLKAAPQVAAPSMSSGHPCAWSPVSVGISVIGFGGAFGGQRIDDACLLGQMQYRGAAISMIAARNPAACRALEAAGNIRAGSCGGSSRAAYAAPAARNNGSNCYEVQATGNTKKRVCN